MLTRRSVLAAGAGALALAACGGSSEGSGSSGGGSSGNGLNLLVVTPEVETGKPTRVAFILQDDEQEYISPKRVVVQFGPAQDRFTSPLVEGQIFTDATPAPPYFTVEAELAPKGTVWAQVTVDGKKAVAPVKIVDVLAGLGRGKPMPGVRTPSPGDAAGLEQVCTRSEGPCPWHDVSLDRALTEGRPMAVLVATPAFCQTAVCGPVLDVLLRAQPQVGDRVRFLHLEVYASRPGREISGTPLAPAVKAFGLASEPTLFIVGADGIVRDRIDGLYGTSESTAALRKLVA